MTTIPRRFIASVSPLAFALGLAALPAPAHAATSSSGSLAVPADTVVFLLEPRTEEQIQGDMEAAQELLVGSAREGAMAELRRAESRARVQATESQIKSTQDELKRVDNLRKNAEDDAVKRTYQVQKEELEQERESLQRRKRLFEADENLGEASKNLSDAQERYAQASMELHRRELQLSLSSDAGRPDAEMTVLEAWKRWAERARDMANRERQVVERQIRVLERAEEIREKG